MATGNYGWNIGDGSDASRDFLTQERHDYSQSPEPQQDNSAENIFTPPSPQQNHVQGHYWCDFGGTIPPGAVKAGVDKDGSNIYIGRAFHEGEMLPAKVVPQNSIAYVAWGGEEHIKNEFEVLCKGGTTVVWHESSHGSIPPGALAIGRTSENERLYVGRVFHDGVLIPGKIQPSHGVCYVPYAGSELSFPDYETLVLLQ